MSTELTAREELYRALIEDAPYQDGSLYGYHSMSALWDCGTNTLYRFGFEAEKEDGHGASVARLYQGNRHDMLPCRYRAERDGSLAHNGFELISPIYNLRTDDYYEHLSSPVLSFLIHSNTSYRCGGHMTVSKSGADQNYYQEKAEQIIPLLYALFPKRAKTHGYARFFNKGDYNDRYNAINISSDKMEIRIFSAIKNLKQLKWRVELLRILFCNERHETLKWDTIAEDLLNINSKLGAHIYSLYGNKYGEKVMLAKAYHKAFLKERLAWQEFSKIGRLIPTAVRSRLLVEPEPKKSNSIQLTLDVCDYSQERSTEA